MGVLAIDIETASPFQEPSPGENDTEYFEWVVTSVAYREDDQSELETDVQFRRGGWDDKYTADMLDQLLDWCDGREIDRVVRTMELGLTSSTSELGRGNSKMKELSQAGTPS